MQILLLKDILTIFGLSVAVLYLCHRMRIPPIVGFLLTGVLAGPHGFGLVKVVEAIEILAEVGVVLLLFTIGLEFSLKSLWQLGRRLLIAASAQVLLTLLAIAFISRVLGQSSGESVFTGFLISLSSTAIVMKILQDKAEVESVQGQTALGILIFQDLVTVPMMLFTPLLAGQGGNWGRALLVFLAEGGGIALLVFVGSKWVVPWILFKITQTRIRELFSLSVVLICLVIAWVSHVVGLSLALGAFLAGLIISESEYGHQALGNILPFRDVFTSFFFVSIGMLLDLDFLLLRPVYIGLITIGVLALKAFLAGSAAIFMGLPLRMAILVGMSLSQIGEFSFILAKTGIDYGLLPKEGYQFFLAVSVLTMAATPFIINLSPPVADLFLRLPLPRKMKRGSFPLRGARRVQEKDHLIIVGFGVNGRNLARAARATGISYVIVEISPETVRREREKGEPIHFGDATQEAVLRHVRIGEARTLVVVINDPTATRRIVELARRLNPKVYIIVRTRYLREMEPLYQLGADEVIPEEFETSVEIFSRVLTKYLLPKEEIERFIAEVRSEGYEMFRGLSKEAMSCRELSQCLPDFDLASFRVDKKSALIDKTLSQVEMRKKHQVTVLAVSRNHQLIYHPDPDLRFLEGDILVVIGKPEKISEVAPLFRSG